MASSITRSPCNGRRFDAAAENGGCIECRREERGQLRRRQPIASATLKGRLGASAAPGRDRRDLVGVGVPVAPVARFGSTRPELLVRLLVRGQLPSCGAW